MELITVFTPTYNRENLLKRLYESLVAQTDYDFIWMVVDDGSTDNTKEVILQFQKTTPFKIEYIYKENGGLHTGYNEAIKRIQTELCMCCDSDDWLPNNCIEIIKQIWSNQKGKDYVGIMGLDCYESGQVVGEPFPPDIHEMYLYEKLTVYNILGDKKMAYRSDLLKMVAPMPTFENEKNFNPSYLMYQLDQFGKLYVTNECFCIVEYQPDGMTKSIYRQYKNSPNSFMEIRRQYLSFPNTSLLFKYRQCVHYVASSIFPKKYFRSIFNSSFPLLTVCATLPGLLLYVYINLRTSIK